MRSQSLSKCSSVVNSSFLSMSHHWFNAHHSERRGHGLDIRLIPTHLWRSIFSWTEPRNRLTAPGTLSKCNYVTPGEAVCTAVVSTLRHRPGHVHLKHSDKAISIRSKIWRTNHRNAMMHIIKEPDIASSRWSGQTDKRTGWARFKTIRKGKRSGSVGKHLIVKYT